MNEHPIKISDPQYDFITSTLERTIMLSGIGSGKSHGLGLISADFVNNYPHAVGFIGTNTHQQLSKSTLNRIFKVWAHEFGWKQDVHFVVNKMPPKGWKMFGERLESYNKTICFANGAMIMTASLENYSAIDGTEFAWALLDETKDTREEAVKEVIVGRLRQVALYINDHGDVVGSIEEAMKLGGNPRGWNPLYIATSPAKVDWINEWFNIGDQEVVEEIHKHIFSKTDYFCREENGKKVIISSSYHNEENLPKNYIENLKRDYAGNENRISMLIYGSPVAKTGGEYVSGFDRMKTVKKVDYLPNYPIHVSFDFNVIHVSILCFQIIKKPTGNYEVRYFDEICLEAPRNNTESACTEFVSKYFLGKKNAGLFYTGDASGSNRTVQSTEHCYDTIRRIFRPYTFSGSDRTISKNPFLIQSRDFINKVLAGGVEAIEVVISPTCKKLITDFEFLKEGPDGGYVKVKAKDPHTGLSYEKHGHLFDTFKYSLIASFPSIYDPE